MEVSYMREKIASVYSSKKWKDRCLYEMGNNQVVAIYFTMRDRGMFDRKASSKKERFEQISMWDTNADIMKEAM